MDDDERHPADDKPRSWDHRDIEYHCVVGFAGRTAANYLLEHRERLVWSEYIKEEE